MDGFDEDTIKLLQKRTYDIAGCTAKDVRVKWNRQLVPVTEIISNELTLAKKVVL